MAKERAGGGAEAAQAWPVRLPYLLLAGKLLLDNLVGFLLPVYLTGIGMTGPQQGVLLSLLVVTALLTAFVSGVGNDRLSTRWFASGGLALSALFYAGLAAATSYPALVALFFIGGVGSNLTYTSLTSLVFKTHDERCRGRAFGDYWAFRAGPAALGLLASALLMRSLAFDALFLIAAAGFLLVLLASLRLEETARAETALAQYARDLRRPGIALLGAVLFLYALHWGCESTVYSLFLERDLGIADRDIPLFIGPPILLLGATSWLVGRALDRGGPPLAFLVAGLALSGLGHVGMAYGPVPVAFALRLVHEAGDACVVVVSFAMLAGMFSRERAGGGSAAVGTVMTLGQFAGTLAFAPLGAAWGYRWPHVISGLAGLAAAAVATRLPGAREALDAPLATLGALWAALRGRPVPAPTDEGAR